MHSNGLNWPVTHARPSAHGLLLSSKLGGCLGCCQVAARFAGKLNRLLFWLREHFWNLQL